LAATKEMVAHHASGKQQNRDHQDYNEQELYKPKPPSILSFRIQLVPIRGHELFSSRSVGNTLGRWEGRMLPLPISLDVFG
jgi:hypothetical protein